MMEKQIEEIKKEICPFYKDYENCEECHDETDDEEPCCFECAAKLIVKYGYRKQIEAEWIPNCNISGRCYRFACGNCGTEKAFSALVGTEIIATLYPYCPKCGANMKGDKT